MKTRNVPRDVAQARSRLGILVRAKADPELIDAARARLAETNAATDIMRWPPLADPVRMRLAQLVLAGNGDAGP
jgi:hypothetical protein